MKKIPDFESYLKSLPLDEQAVIRKAEREYLDRSRDRLRSLEQTYADQMVGTQVVPSGQREWHNLTAGSNADSELRVSRRKLNDD